MANQYHVVDKGWMIISSYCPSLCQFKHGVKQGGALNLAQETLDQKVCEKQLMSNIETVQHSHITSLCI